MKASEVIELLGGLTATARVCGVAAPTVHEWRSRGAIPVDRCPAIAAALGKTCEEIRPEIEWVRGASGEIKGHVVLIQGDAA